MKRLTVVEDNPDNRLLLRVILQDHYELTDYETGAAAWGALLHSRPDAVLLDISLPDMEGTDLLRRIREHPALRDLPVIALTAHAMSGDREKYISLGFDEYLTKPIVDETILIEAIERMLVRQTSPKQSSSSG
jgi:two-component system, cell cycle response regulator DivK